jgi:hypothetical protein
MTRSSVACSVLVAFLALPVGVSADDAPGAEGARPVPLSPRRPLIFASPVHGGCYIAAPGQCKIHVEPFTININSGQKLVLFKLVTVKGGTGTLTTIYDWRPDQSNPAPASGDTYTPSLVTQDFAATCGSSYEVSLQGQDTGDGGSTFSLGLTGQFTCPSTAP